MGMSASIGISCEKHRQQAKKEAEVRTDTIKEDKASIEASINQPALSSQASTENTDTKRN